MQPLYSSEKLSNHNILNCICYFDLLSPRFLIAATKVYTGTATRELFRQLTELFR